MTPHRSNGRGSLRIDLRLRGVGRIARATGTSDPQQLELYRGMLRALAAAGRIDILRAIRDGVVSIAEAWDAYRPQIGRPADLNRLPTPETLRRLWATNVTGAEVGALETWVAAYDTGDDNRTALRKGFRGIRLGAKESVTVGDLPALLKACRARHVKAGTARAFNATRTAVQAFLRDTLGPQHWLWAAVKEIKPLAYRSEPGRPFESPSEASAYCEALGPVYGPMFWAMCITGMNPREFWGRWEYRDVQHCLHVFGTKRKARDRDVPVIDRVARPTRAYDSFENFVKKFNSEQREQRARGASGAFAHRTPYDGRRTFARWMENAGIPRSRRIAYMGHTARDMTDRYERPEIMLYIKLDSEILRRYVGVNETVGRAPDGTD